MSVREMVEEHRLATLAVAAVICAGVATLLFWRDTADGRAQTALNQAFYTTDDGKTWFADDANLVYPFDHDGKPAYRANVFKCGENGKPFVAYLERIGEPTHSQLLQLKSRGTPQAAPAAPPNMMEAREVKKPGESEWVKMTSAKATVVMTPKSPDGSPQLPQPLRP